MVVSHHGRPIKLDLDCSETLRCPLLSFPLLAPVADGGSANLTAHQRLGPCRTEDERDDIDDETTCMERTPEGIIGQPAACDGSNHQHGGSQTTKRGLSMAPRTENDPPAHSAALDSDDDAGSENPEGDDDGVMEEEEEDGIADRNRHHVHPPQPRQHPQKQHHGGLVPVQLVAVLVDGSGKGWMAARRLWSVGEVGFQALSQAGLSAGDVDVDQEVSRKLL